MTDLKEFPFLTLENELLLKKNYDWTEHNGVTCRLVPASDLSIFQSVLHFHCGRGVPFPQNEYQAKGMQLLGYDWLKHNKPECLRAPPKSEELNGEGTDAQN